MRLGRHSKYFDAKLGQNKHSRQTLLDKLIANIVSDYIGGSERNMVQAKYGCKNESV